MCLGVCMARSIAHAGGSCHPGDAGALGTTALMGLSPLLPHRFQTERLGEQHVAELAGIDLNRGPGIEGTSKALRHGLVPNATDPRRDLPSTACLGQPNLQGLHAAAQGPADKDRPKESPIMIIDAACEASHALLIRDRRLPEVHRTAIRQRQRQADRRQPLIAIEQHTALVMPQDGAALRHKEMAPGRGVLDVGRDFGGKIPLHIASDGGLNHARQLGRPWRELDCRGLACGHRTKGWP
jgi:hypothetical protein